MKKLSLIILTFSIILFGCTHTHKINIVSTPSTFDEINTILKSQKARITLANEDEFIVKGLQISRDSTFWSDPSTNHRHSVSTLKVEKIVILKRGRGALEGLKYGAIIGGTAGLITGFTIEDLPFLGMGKDEYGFPKSVLGWGVWWAANVGILGLPIGAIVGSKDKYILIAPIDSSLTNKMKH